MLCVEVRLPQVEGALNTVPLRVGSHKWEVKGCPRSLVSPQVPSNHHPGKPLLEPE